VKLLHLIDFITEKFVTMYGHMNVKLLMYTTTVRDVYITMIRMFRLLNRRQYFYYLGQYNCSGKER